MDKLENYVLEFGIRGRGRWTQPEDWSWHRRYSLDEDGDQTDDEAQQSLARIDGLRRQAMESLAELDTAVHAAQNVRELTTALYELLVRLEVPAHLSDWTKLAEADGRLADAAEHRQIWADTMGLFDQLVEISGEEAMTLTDFTAGTPTEPPRPTDARQPAQQSA